MGQIHARGVAHQAEAGGKAPFHLGGAEETARHLIARLKEYRPNIFCIVITGNADKESAVTALRNGAYDYMTKPLHPSELFSVIERCLDKHRLEARADATFDALQIAKDAAEAASKGKSQFFATMSRELRKPITAILNSANALMEQKHGELGAPQYMDHARNIRNGSSETGCACCCASAGSTANPAAAMTGSRPRIRRRLPAVAPGAGAAGSC